MTSAEGSWDNALTESFHWRDSTIRWGAAGHGPPVVLCHGTPWSSFVWRATVNTLEDQRQVFFWDMLGYGHSDKPDTDVSLNAQGQLLSALMKEWGVDTADLVCHDIGGAVALRAHLLHGMPIASLALIDVVALRPWGSPFFQLVAQHADTFAALPTNLHLALVAEYIRGASNTQLSPEVLERLVDPWRGEGQSAFYRQIAQADQKHTAELEDLLHTIDVPTLVVWGSDDTWIPIDHAHRLVRQIPTGELVIVQDAGHLVQEDAPDLLNDHLQRWLAQQSPEEYDTQTLRRSGPTW